MTVIPCARDDRLRAIIESFAETLRTEAHLLGEHGLEEKDFYNSGVLRGAVEKLRGEYVGTTRAKREFTRHILNFLEDGRLIAGWDPSKGGARHDFQVRLNSGRLAVIVLKGCLDGNNTNIFERPTDADEFVIWSLCLSPGADPRHNAWSGIHTRLSAEMILKHQRVDGLIVWDMVCGTIGRPCPKLERLHTDLSERTTPVGPFKTPPPCVYVFPSSIPYAAQPLARAQPLEAVEFLAALHAGFAGWPEEVNYVDFEIAAAGEELHRRTTIRRGGQVVSASDMTPIRRV
ncbi:MAG: hypothetical protein Q8N19_02425 [Phenylobacterium sp.]|uniref:hypothetical protein n=1 Tax=Phenylobacterium sp. TaxID=1871053 RepID=UPI0027356920|nr:hypothetical protein [Phenylobacterium sp.]MDP3115950.1 hypothetical protein [Phenylobacterium sp.]